MILAVWLLPHHLFAKPIGSMQALQNVQEFLKTRGISAPAQSPRRAPMAGMPSEEAPYYIFNLGDDGGFVIASGDDRTYPILAYSDKGSMKPDDLPDNVRYWLDYYKAQIKALKNSGTSVASPRRAPATVVEPLVTAHWDQRTPYNLTCPVRKGKRCVTGCVATAMAQVMYAHRKYSTHQVMADIPGYDDSWPDDPLFLETIPEGTHIDWDGMIDDYSGSYSQTQAMAVANLMLYCGVSVKMWYNPDASGASLNEVPAALISYFDYDDAVSFEYREDYSDSRWESKVYSELAKGNPIVYAGGTHAFVIDGCDAEGFVHVNWGWGGSADGYFALTSTYDNVLDGYSESQQAIFGAVPNGAFPRLTTNNIALDSPPVVEELSAHTSIPVAFTLTLANLTEKNYSFEQAIGLYQNGQLKEVAGTLDLIADMAANTTTTVNVSLNLDARLEKGVYQLRPISRKAGADKWRWNDNYDKYLTLAIHGDKATITVGIPPEEGDIITFADPVIKRLCVENWDINGDGKLSQQEAAEVESLDNVFNGNEEITSFDELQYFTGLTVIEDNAFYNCSLSSCMIPPQVVSIGKNAFYRTSLKRIIIPASIKKIGVKAFNGNKELEDIIVEKGNTVYDSRNDCHALIETSTNTLLTGCKNTIIPDGVKTIGEEAFYVCIGLTSITMPETVTSIGKSAFCYCGELKQLNLSEALTEIGDLAFSSCHSLTDITIPKNVRTINRNPFSYCENLESIVVDPQNPYFDSRDGCNAVMEKGTNRLISGCQATIIPSDTEGIGDDAFRGCSKLTSVNIPSNVSSIGNYAFSECPRLTHLELPEGLTTIGTCAFMGASALTTVTLPSTITAIGNNAFIFDENLVTVEARMKNPVDITSGTFYSASKATLYVPVGSATSYRSANYWKNFKIIVEGSIPYRDIIDFADSETKAICLKNWDKNGDLELTKEEAAEVTSLESTFSAPIPDEVEYFGYSYEYPHYFNELQYFTGLTTISSYAFSYSLKLKSVTLPPTITSIEERAFTGCKRLQSLDVPEGVTTICSGAFEECKSLASVSLPESLTSIESGAFQACYSLTSIHLPAKVNTIPQSAFRNCHKLEYVTIPETIRQIGDDAFYGCSDYEYYQESQMEMPVIIDDQEFEEKILKNCTGLVAVSIPSQVESVGQSAFACCNALTSVEVNRREPLAINKNTFTNYTGATLYVPKGSRDSYMAADTWKLFGQIVEMSGIEGDVNCDGNVSVVDVMQLVNVILGSGQSFPLTLSDVNHDGRISVTDVLIIVDMILTNR